MKELNRQNLDEELYVAEYNFSQRCFHHSFIKKSLEDNREMIARVMMIDDVKRREEMLSQCAWIPFSIGTYEETSEDIQQMRNFIGKQKDWTQFQNPNLL